jgi:hypothetical protein
MNAGQAQEVATILARLGQTIEAEAQRTDDAEHRANLYSEAGTAYAEAAYLAAPGEFRRDVQQAADRMTTRAASSRLGY